MVAEQDIKSMELPYYDEMQYFCLKNCFFQYMHFMGLDDGLLKLRTGLEFKIKRHGDEGNFSVVQHSMLLPFFDMKKAVSGHGEDSDGIFTENIAHLPVIVLVDVFYLPYRKEYRKYHASHAIFLCEYNSSAKEVYVIDWYAPYFYKGTIPLADFMEARGSVNPKDSNPFSGFKIDNYWYKIPRDTGIDNMENIDRNIAAIYQNNERGTGKDILAGAEALDYIWTVFKEALNSDESVRKKMCNKLHDELFVWQRSAGLSLRYYESAGELMSLKWQESFMTMLTGINDVLKKTSFWLMRGSLSKPEEYLEKCVAEWQYLRDVHNRFAEEMTKSHGYAYQI